MGRKRIFTSFPLIGKPCDNLGSDLGQNSFFSNVFKHIPSCFAGSYNTLLDNGESLVDRFAYFGACNIPHNTSNEATDNWANNITSHMYDDAQAAQVVADIRGRYIGPFTALAERYLKV